MKTKIIDEQELVTSFGVQNEQTFLAFVADYDKSQEDLMRTKGFRYKGEVERTVAFTFGEVTFRRKRWVKDGQSLFPVDQKLGLPKHTRYSLELLYQIAKLATMVSYRQVVAIIALTYRISITKDTVLEAVKFSGQLLEEREHYRFYEDEETIEKKEAEIIYVEGDGVLVKCSEEGLDRHNKELAHFVIHTGLEKIAKGRPHLQDKKSIIQSTSHLAREQVHDYLYNHFQINSDTILVTNSDGGKGYTPYLFKELAKALGIQRHEHFWDAYHVNKLVKKSLNPYSTELANQALEAIYRHDKASLRTVLDTAESMIEDSQELDLFQAFKRRFLKEFAFTKPASLRDLPKLVIGIMESQHRKVTYRMKHRGMYWSERGAETVSRLILLREEGQLRDLYFGDWRERYDYYKELEITTRDYLRELQTSHYHQTHRLAANREVSKKLRDL